MPKRRAAQYRDAQVTCIFGKNGTGKSTLVKNIADRIGGKVLICTYAGMPKIWRGVPILDATKRDQWQQWESGMKQVIVSRTDHPTKSTQNYIFEHIYRNFKGGTIIFDDCREYITDKITNHPFLKKILSSFRHRELDLFFVMHSPADVPRQVWIYNSTTFVGHTDQLINTSHIRTSSAQMIERAQKKIAPEFRRRKAKNNGSHYGLFIKIDT